MHLRIIIRKKARARKGGSKETWQEVICSKDKTKIMPKKKLKASEETAELGFLKLGTVDRDSTVEYSLVNIAKVKSSNMPSAIFSLASNEQLL